ncbi:uncharacterized protein LOC116346802 [Contarinia nasturtii]|uniref:uncharacterized protein LOC116346802 n=1 Tax=Contarinia nasturtii TaxID=265458 RepID=UPI0012D3BC7B|nr:uncharacterized protein LOC116346802 [Contarinia nasturtii]
MKTSDKASVKNIIRGISNRLCVLLVHLLVIGVASIFYCYGMESDAYFQSSFAVQWFFLMIATASVPVLKYIFCVKFTCRWTKICWELVMFLLSETVICLSFVMLKDKMVSHGLDLNSHSMDAKIYQAVLYSTIISVITTTLSHLTVIYHLVDDTKDINPFIFCMRFSSHFLMITVNFVYTMIFALSPIEFNQQVTLYLLLILPPILCIFMYDILQLIWDRLTKNPLRCIPRLYTLFVYIVLVYSLIIITILYKKQSDDYLKVNKDFTSFIFIASFTLTFSIGRYHILTTKLGLLTFSELIFKWNKEVVCSRKQKYEMESTI